MRDGLHYAARGIFLTAGPPGGHTSSEFHFLWNAAGTPSLSDIHTLTDDVIGFWNTVPTGGSSYAPGHWYGPQVSRTPNASELAIYSLDPADPHHYYGSPVNVKTWNLTTGVGTGPPLPNECCAVLSYRADYGTDPEHGGTTRPRADDRGRIYFGPLDVNAINDVVIVSGLHQAQIHPNVSDSLLGGISTLKTATQGHSFTLSVWSRKLQTFKPVLDKAMNVDFDTQRKRGLATSLLTWTVA